MFAKGQYATDEIMSKYVEFICSCISLNAGGSIHHTDGFPMKGYYIPVKLEILSHDARTATIKVNTLGFSKDIILFMSRHKSPDKILHELQKKIDEVILEIIKDNNLNQDKIFSDHHAFKQLRTKIK